MHHTENSLLKSTEFYREQWGWEFINFFIEERWNLKFGLRKQMEKGIRKDRETKLQHSLSL